MGDSLGTRHSKLGPPQWKGTSARTSSVQKEPGFIQDSGLTVWGHCIRGGLACGWVQLRVLRIMTFSLKSLSLLETLCEIDSQGSNRGTRLQVEKVAKPQGAVIVAEEVCSSTVLLPVTLQHRTWTQRCLQPALWSQQVKVAPGCSLPAEGTQLSIPESMPSVLSLEGDSPKGEPTLGSEHRKGKASLMFRLPECLRADSGHLSSDHGGLCTPEAARVFLRKSGFKRRCSSSSPECLLAPPSPFLTGSQLRAEKTARSSVEATRQNHHCPLKSAGKTTGFSTLEFF